MVNISLKISHICRFSGHSARNVKYEYQFSSVAQSCPTLCDFMDCSTPGSSVLHYLLEFAQICVHWVSLFQFSSVQLLSCVWFFAIPWTAACKASLSITNSQSFLKLMSIESVMPSNHHPLSSPSSPTLTLSQHQGLFQWVSSLHQVAKALEFQLQHQSFQWTPRTDLL